MDSFTDLSAVTAQPEAHAANPTPPFSRNGAHPPYSEMIIAAIVGLNDKDGSSRQAIAKFIEKEYANLLPPTHPNLLTQHLKRMKNEGQLVMVKYSYMLPTNTRSFHFQPPPMPAAADYYSVTTTTTVTPRRKVGRPPKPRHDFASEIQPQFGQTPAEPMFASLGLADEGLQQPPTENANADAAMVKRGRGRPPKGTMVNGGVKKGKPKRFGGGPTTLPLSGNVTRPKRAVSKPQHLISLVNQTSSFSRAKARGRGRPLKNNFTNSFGPLSKVGPGTAVLVTDPQQLVAYLELKLKYEHLQSKAKEVVGVVRPYINPDYDVFEALQELEMLVGTDKNVQNE